MDLFEAIEAHDVDGLLERLERGADPNVGHALAPAWTPLKAAVEELADGGPAEAVVLLLRHGAAVDGGRVPGNTTALIVAAMNGTSDGMRLLLAAGADPNVRDEEGDTPLQSCVRNGDAKSARLLTLCGAKSA